MSTRPPGDPFVIALFSEIVMIEQLARIRISRAMPKGMELSHFMVLNHFSRLGGEKTPGQLARIFHVTKGAMTNTVRKLDEAGYVHVRPDWDDARRKWVGISPAAVAAAAEPSKARRVRLWCIQNPPLIYLCTFLIYQVVLLTRACYRPQEGACRESQ